MIEIMYAIHEWVNSPTVYLFLQLICATLVILGVFSVLHIDKKK